VAPGPAPSGGKGSAGWDKDLERTPFDISGQVLNEAGNAIPGIGVIAVARVLFDEVQNVGVALGERSERRVLTDTSGHFEFRGLANGEYEVRTLESYQYPETSSIAVRAGTDTVRLVVVEQRDIWIDGYVADVQGKPLGGVRVFPLGAADPSAVSNDSGTFAFPLTVRSDRHYAIVFRQEGYAEHRASISKADWVDGDTVELDVTLRPEQTLTTVSGLVRSKTGVPIPGEQVYLQRPQQKYRAMTDESGRFLFTGVESGGGYALWLLPHGPFQRFRQENVKVPAEGLGNLEVALDPVSTGRVSGRVLDTRGNPVPGFRLWVRSENSRNADLQVTSGYDGYYAAEEIPEGRVRLETGSFPRFITSGVALPPGGDILVDPILDIGNGQIAGRVVDTENRPVPGADLTLSWVSRQPPLLHESLRKTVADADGAFLFNQLGNSAHKLLVRAPGFGVAEVEHAAGGDLVIRLEPAVH